MDTRVDAQVERDESNDVCVVWNQETFEPLVPFVVKPWVKGTDPRGHYVQFRELEAAQRRIAELESARIPRCKTCQYFRAPGYVPVYGTCDLTRSNKPDDGSGYCSEHVPRRSREG